MTDAPKPEPMAPISTATLIVALLFLGGLVGCCTAIVILGYYRIAMGVVILSWCSAGLMITLAMIITLKTVNGRPCTSANYPLIAGFASGLAMWLPIAMSGMISIAGH